MHQLERVTNLLALLLSARRHLTFEEIRAQLKGQYPENLVAARAAFERDKAILRDEGVPIDSEVQGGDKAGMTGYLIKRSAYELGDLDLSTQEAAALRVAVSTLRMGQSWGEEALWKVDMEEHGSQLAPTSAHATLLVHPNLPLLHEALIKKVAVGFTYSDRQRVVEPYGLLARSGWWYLVGHDQSVNAERTFRVDRIEGEVSVRRDISCTRPSDFDIRKAFPVDLKELPGAIDVGSEVAQVLVNASDVGVVLGQYTQSAVVENRADGSVVFEVPCSNVQAFEQWLFGFLDRAEVLAPPALRQHVIDWLLEMTGSVTRGER